MTSLGIEPVTFWLVTSASLNYVSVCPLYLEGSGLLMVYYAYFHSFIMALFFGVTLHMPLMFFVYKRGG
jgi:hypothetical protein